MRYASRWIALFALLALALPAGADSFPDEIALPDDLQPEGIAVGRGHTAYVGSLTDGSIVEVDLRSGSVTELADPSGPFSTVGIEVDQRNRIWAAGGPTGTGRVHDAATGEVLGSWMFTAPGASFINDVVVTRDAAYFTDSGSAQPGAAFAGAPRLFVVPLANDGTPSEDFEILDLDVPDIAFPNLNGIETTPGDRALVVGHTTAGVLFEVDPSDGSADAVDIGRPLEGADGLVRSGNTVYVVENAAQRITSVRLTGNGAAITGSLAVEGAETPTTAGIFGSALYAVDARFASGVAPFRIFRVER